jgi:hypothetical protein
MSTGTLVVMGLLAAGLLVWLLGPRVVGWLFVSLHDGRAVPVWPYLMERK